MSSINKLFRLKTYRKYNQLISCYSKYHTISGVYGYKPKSKPITEEKSYPKLGSDVNPQLRQLVDAFRLRGHLLSRLDPLGLSQPESSDALEINVDSYARDQSVIDPKTVVNIDLKECSISSIVNLLFEMYCGNTGIEFMHLTDANERFWIANKWEEMMSNTSGLSSEDKKRLAIDLLKSQLFDQFVAKKFSSVKRYGGEGSETMITFFEHIFAKSVDHSVTDVVIGMPHRGRLNLLANSLEYPPVLLFQKMLGKPEFDLSKANGATGDVLSHMFTSIDRKSGNGSVHIILLPNPSHLEAISPVVCGKARAKAMTKRIGPYEESSESRISPVLGIQVHGDAAFTGQGIIMETLAMYNVPHFSVDGSIHLIVNNQIGYTTPGQITHGRSSRYCTDIFKAIDCPIVHVNGEDPESVVKVAQFALEYRQRFGKDIGIDLVCYRQWGHNELDDPTFTNPLMYDRIRSREQTIPDKYANKVLSSEERDEVVNGFSSLLNKHFEDVNHYKPINTNFKGVWSHVTQASSDCITRWDTSVDPNLLSYICQKSSQVPKDFALHSTLSRVLNERVKRVVEGVKIDWATAETIAFGSLLYQGFNVRISGQDVGRGTFSQRHAMLVDQNNGDTYIPLNNLVDNQKGFLEVCNSILSEEAVLGFEYGFSLDNPNHLVIWEAQFGDFFNGAQIIFDTFLSSGETKWGLSSPITCLLPHGYEGAGPEHSSCRIERFLQMCDSKENAIDSDHVNWSVANPSTPSQYFHLLRRQLIRNYRKPLIAVTPKILLRHPNCVSTIDEFTNSSYFKPVLSDPKVTKDSDIKRVVFCSGKHYYTLMKEREDRNVRQMAIVRIEELCPFPAKEISEQIAKYKSAKEWIWSQEEHRNMGAWSFVKNRFQDILNCNLRYVGRPPLSAPAVGIGQMHKSEAQNIVDNTFQGL